MQVSYISPPPQVRWVGCEMMSVNSLAAESVVSMLAHPPMNLEVSWLSDPSHCRRVKESYLNW